MIAGIIQTPARQSPYVNRGGREIPSRLHAAADGRQRLHHAGAGRRVQEEADRHARPAAAACDRWRPFFTEEVRKYLEQKYGAKALYESGLSVQTGIDIGLQRAANRAVDRGLRMVDKRRGYRRDKPNIVAQGHNIETYRHERWAQPIAAGRHRPGGCHERVTGIGESPHRPADRRASRRGHRVGEARAAGAVQGRRLDRRARDAGGSVGESRRRSRSSSRRSSKARSWPSTTAPARFARWSAGSASIAASSIARRRRTARSARCSNRSSIPRRSIAATRRPPSSLTSRSPTIPARDSRPTSRRTTTGSTREASRCATRSKTRGTCRP